MTPAEHFEVCCFSQYIKIRFSNDLWAFSQLTYLFCHYSMSTGAIDNIKEGAGGLLKWARVPTAHDPIMESWVIINCSPTPNISSPAYPTFSCVRCALILQGDQSEVDSSPFDQLTVCSLLHGLSMLKTNDDICISYCGEAMGDRNCGPARSHLHIYQVLGCHSTKQVYCRC